MTLALFDFDGTITTHETMPDFLRRSISRWRLVIGWILLAPIVAGYRVRIVSGRFARSLLVRFAYTGMPVSALTIRGEDFAKDRLPHVLRPEAMERIAWHRAQGHKVVVVSGGLDVYLRPWCEAQGLDLLCSTLEVRNGRLTGRYDGEQCVLAEKVRRVRQAYDVGAFSEIYAYGDTAEDQDLLALASRKFYRWQEIAASPA